ncbi:MAG: hypothetical protein V4508_10845 [Pseudomonadota bacterium]
MRTLLLALLALVAGCTTPQERAASMQAEMDRMVQAYGPACVRLGYTAQTDAWRNCVLHLSTKDDIQRYAYSYPPYYFGGFPHSRWGPW